LTDLDDLVGERFRYGLEELWVGVAVGVVAEVFDEDAGQVVQVASGPLQGQEDQHTQPIEHIMNRGCCEGTSATHVQSIVLPRDLGYVILLTCTSKVINFSKHNKATIKHIP
jgi:hypothetical protein